MFGSHPSSQTIEARHAQRLADDEVGDSDFHRWSYIPGRRGCLGNSYPIVFTIRVIFCGRPLPHDSADHGWRENAVSRSIEPRGSQWNPLASRRLTTGYSDWIGYRLKRRFGTFAKSLYRDVQSPVGLCAGKFGGVTTVAVGCIKSLRPGTLPNHYFSPSVKRITERRWRLRRAAIAEHPLGPRVAGKAVGFLAGSGGFLSWGPDGRAEHGFAGFGPHDAWSRQICSTKSR